MTEKTGINAPRLFGRTRTAILVMLFLLPDSYPRQLAVLLDLSLSTIQNALVKLEQEGVVAGRSVGNMRRVALNPRYFGARQLRDLLAKLAEGYPAFEERAAQVRLRPRLSGKPI